MSVDRFLKDPFTREEVARASQVPLTTDMEIAAHRVGTAMLGMIAEDVMLPLFNNQLNLDDTEKAISGTFYRMVGMLKALRALNQPAHFQAVGSVTRTLFELCLDVALLTGNTTPKLEDATEKFHQFTRVARLRAAQKIVGFYNEHPDLDDSEISEQRQLVANAAVAAEVEGIVRTQWGVNKKGNPIWPRHWSGLDAADQAKRAGLRMEELHRRYVDLLNWQIHGGAAGVGGLSFEALRGIEVLAGVMLREAIPDALRRMGVALQMHRVLSDLFEHLDDIVTRVEAFGRTDIQLQRLGHPSKFA